MSASLLDRPSLNDYQLRLPSFEGPLDVLLRLIERSQLAITDVSLVAVTEQFVAYVAQLDSAPVETIADFTAVAARLTVLKSRSLLPRPPATADEPATDDLARELIAYRQFKEAAQTLADWDASGRGAFSRSAAPVAAPPPAVPARLAPLAPRALVHALKRRLTTVPRAAEVRVLAPVISLREMIERVIGAVRDKHEIPFDVATGNCRQRTEVMTAFIAVLILIRRRLLEAEQTELFGDIVLRPIDPTWATTDMFSERAADD